MATNRTFEVDKNRLMEMEQGEETLNAVHNLQDALKIIHAQQNTIKMLNKEVNSLKILAVILSMSSQSALLCRLI